MQSKKSHLEILSGHLKALQRVKRQKHHRLQHQLHHQFRISKATLFYIKEYGPHTHVSKTIIRESLKILLLASFVSSFGGVALEHVKVVFVAIVPLTILLPTLNDMIGDFGTVISSRFSSLLHEGQVQVGNFFDPKIIKLVAQILIVALVTGVLSAGLALMISVIYHASLSFQIIDKIFLVTIIDIFILIGFLSVIAVVSGFYFFKKGEDPNNFLIPITTSVADFGNMLLLALLVRLLF